MALWNYPADDSAAGRTQRVSRGRGSQVDCHPVVPEPWREVATDTT